MSVSTDISDDIVTAIDAGSYAIEKVETFAAERIQVIDPEMIETDKLLVMVAPRAIDISWLNRNAVLNLYTFVISLHVGDDHVPVLRNTLQSFPKIKPMIFSPI